MTSAVQSPRSGAGARPPDRKNRTRLLAGAAVVVAAALGVGLGLGLSGSSGPPASSAAGSYGYYQSVMGRYGHGGMMGGNSMMGTGGYRWMMGGAQPPRWMAGSALPGSMMGSSTDPGEIMGSLFAGAPGPKVGTDDVNTLAARTPAGATVDRAANRITFAATDIAYAVVASPSGADDRFETAGLVNPTITVPVGAHVTVQFVNADTTSAHGLVISTPGAAATPMPMMRAHVAFDGAATWFLGDATGAGAHITTMALTATTAGGYQYLCPVPGHAQKGMAGTFTVTG